MIRWPNRDRLPAVHDALWQGWSVTEICEISGFDPWFIHQLAQIVAFEKELADLREVGAEVSEKQEHASPPPGGLMEALTPTLLRKAKQYGLSDDAYCGVTRPPGGGYNRSP